MLQSQAQFEMWCEMKCDYDPTTGVYILKKLGITLKVENHPK